MAIRSFYMGFDTNLRIKGSVNLGTPLNPNVVDNYDGPVVFGKTFTYTGRGGGWIYTVYPNREWDPGGYWIATSPWWVACFGQIDTQRHYTRFCRLEIDDNTTTPEHFERVVSSVTLIEEINLMDYVSSIPWDFLSERIADFFPDLVDPTKYLWWKYIPDLLGGGEFKHYGISLIKYARSKFDSDRFSWIGSSWVIPVEAPELFDAAKYNWTAFSGQIAAFAPQFLNESTASLFNWDDPDAIAAVQRFCPEKMALNPNR